MRRSTAIGAARMAGLFAMGEIPGIIRRSAPCDGSGIGIGISFPLFEEGSRLRFATSVAAESIRAVQTPCDIIDLPFDSSVKPLQALAEIRQALPEWQGRLGVFGASALQIVTQLPYLHEGSDIDLVFNGGSPDALLEAHRVLQEVESLSGIRIDAEVIAGRRLGIKLCELFRNQKTVLAKTINSVEVLDRNEVLSLLGAVWQSAI
jgi:phosphoribosyl-dephospho-CoA transferase